MLEDGEPVFGLRAREDATLGLERNEGLYVVAHDPRERKVRNGRNEIGKIDGSFTVRFEEQALMKGGVTWSRQGADAGHDFALAFDEVETAGFGERGEIVREVASRGALIRV